MKRELRKQIKQDDLVTGFEQASGWVKTHWSEVRITLTVLAIVGVGGGAVAYFQTHRNREAEAAFAEAYDIYRTPPGSDRPAGAGGGASSPGGEERLKKAAAAFDGVERGFASLPVAVRARYYGALCRIELGRFDEAEKALQETLARKEGPSLDIALARLAIADLYYRKGAVSKAEDAYRQFVSDASLPFPRDYALMRLATILEDAGKASEATAAYRRLGEDFPASVYAPEARRRAEYLESAGEG